ncbi:MAG: MATE family efflux transporter [Christensenellales bacterium]
MRFRRDGLRRRDDLAYSASGQHAGWAERRRVRGRRPRDRSRRPGRRSCAVHTSMALAVLSGVLLGALLLLLSAPLLELMGCPENVLAGAKLYLNIYAVGLPASLIYNYGAAILRAVGDTKRPLYYLTISGVVNIILNVLLVAGLKLSVAGVAIATIVSEFISAALVLASLITSHGDIRFEPKKTRVERRSLSLILRIGIPAGLQSSMFSISNVLIQSAINSFGAAAIAGNTAAASIEGFATTVSNSISQAALTFSSQNMGAEKYQRVRRVLAVCLAATLVGGLTLGLLIYAFGTPLLSLFNTDPDVIANGLIRVSHNMPLYVLFCMQDTFVGQLRGIGYSLLPTITSLSGICRCASSGSIPPSPPPPPSIRSISRIPFPWAVTLAALVVCYAVVVRKPPKA